LDKDTRALENREEAPFLNPKVEEVFKAYPHKVGKKLLFLRQLIFDVASEISEVGELEETLKWGEPSYLTTKSKTGSAIRIDWKPAQQNQYAMYFNCNTNLVEAFRKRYPRVFRFRGKRCIVFDINDEIATDELRNCIAMALTYHLNKKRKS